MGRAYFILLQLIKFLQHQTFLLPWLQKFSGKPYFSFEFFILNNFPSTKFFIQLLGLRKFLALKGATNGATKERDDPKLYCWRLATLACSRLKQKRKNVQIPKEETGFHVYLFDKLLRARGVGWHRNSYSPKKKVSFIK